MCTSSKADSNAAGLHPTAKKYKAPVSAGNQFSLYVGAQQIYRLQKSTFPTYQDTERYRSHYVASFKVPNGSQDIFQFCKKPKNGMLMKSSKKQKNKLRPYQTMGGKIDVGVSFRNYRCRTVMMWNCPRNPVQKVSLVKVLLLSLSHFSNRTRQLWSGVEQWKTSAEWDDRSFGRRGKNKAAFDYRDTLHNDCHVSQRSHTYLYQAWIEPLLETFSSTNPTPPVKPSH